MNAKNIHQARPSQNLDARNIQPPRFAVYTLSAEAFELELPSTM